MESQSLDVRQHTFFADFYQSYGGFKNLYQKLTVHDGMIVMNVIMLDDKAEFMVKKMSKFSGIVFDDFMSLLDDFSDQIETDYLLVEINQVDD
jgi:hypothetical protein